jgi:hypothetical protein
MIERRFAVRFPLIYKYLGTDRLTTEILRLSAEEQALLELKVALGHELKKSIQPDGNAIRVFYMPDCK